MFGTRNRLARTGALVAPMVLFATLPATAMAAEAASRSSSLVDVTGLFLLGLLLILVELFLFPGHGIAALPGAALIFWSIYRCVEELGPETGATVAALELAAAGLVAYALMKVFPLTPAAAALFHKTHLAHRVYNETESLHEMTWVGRRGTASSDLRPAGAARFDDRTLDVVSEDGYLDKGTTVMVTRFDEGRIVVKKSADS